MQWNIENSFDYRYLQMNQILALDNPQGIDILLNKETKQNWIFIVTLIHRTDW